MGTRKASLRDKPTKNLYYYLIEYEVIKGKTRHFTHIRVIAKGHGIPEAIKTSEEIIVNHINNTEGLEGCTYKLLKWDRYDHRPKYSNVIAASPVLKTKI